MWFNKSQNWCNFILFNLGETYYIDPKNTKLISEEEWKIVIENIEKIIEEHNKKIQKNEKKKKNYKKGKKIRKTYFNVGGESS